MSNTDSEVGGLGPHQQQKRQLIKWVPDLSSGSLLTTLAMLAAVGGFWSKQEADNARRDERQAQLASLVATDKAAAKEQIAEVRKEVYETRAAVGEVGKAVNDIRTSVAVIEARQGVTVSKGKP